MVRGTSQCSHSGWVLFSKRCFLLNRHAFNLNLANTISSSLLFLWAEGQSLITGFIGYKCNGWLGGLFIWSHLSCHFLHRWFLTLVLNWLYAMGIWEILSRYRADLAPKSAASFPGIPIWLGIHSNSIVLSVEATLSKISWARLFGSFDFSVCSAL